jgi:hypothetical protein
MGLIRGILWRPHTPLDIQAPTNPFSGLEYLAALDTWRAVQKDKPSRSEAIRRLTAAVIKTPKQKPLSRKQESKMELRRCFGQSGQVYYVTFSPETYWDVFVETPAGFKPVTARVAALDCGAEAGEPTEANTHKFWRQLWKT